MAVIRTDRQGNLTWYGAQVALTRLSIAKGPANDGDLSAKIDLSTIGFGYTAAKNSSSVAAGNQQHRFACCTGRHNIGDQRLKPWDVRDRWTSSAAIR